MRTQIGSNVSFEEVVLHFKPSWKSGLGRSCKSQCQQTTHGGYLREAQHHSLWARSGHFAQRYIARMKDVHHRRGRPEADIDERA